VSDLDAPTPSEQDVGTPADEGASFVPTQRQATDSRARRRNERRFIAVYAALGVVLVGAIAGFAVILAKPSAKPAAAWSSWEPAGGTTNQMTTQIAQHVAHQYRLSKNGGQLVAIVPSKPTVTSGTTDIAIKAIAIRKAANTNTGIEVLGSTGTEMFNFCGLGQRCSIASGKATSTRGRLVRREALEVALYTFKFVPGVNSIIAFMPPPPNATSAPVLFLRKENFKDALDRPLAQTLKLAEPPLPTQADATEGTTIDQLTLPSLFSYELQALQTGGAALVLDPTT
jgi:hypothetical protein